MGITLIFLVIVSVIMFLAFLLPAFIAIRKNEKAKPPRDFSFIILGLLILNWLFFLMNGYVLLPEAISEAIFMPVWVALCVAGGFTAIYEFRNNKGFAIPVAGLTTVSLLFTIFISGLSKM